MSWLLIVVTTWTVLAVGLGLLIGRSLQVADMLVAGKRVPVVPDFVPADWNVPATE